MASTRTRKRPEASQASLKKYNPQFLECRDFQHPFRTIGYHRTDDGSVQRQMICTRCGAVGKDKIAKTGERISTRRYKWPEGYKLDGFVAKDRIRAEQVRRAKVFPNESAMLAALAGSRSRVNGARKSAAKKPQRKRYPVHANKRERAGAKR